SFGHEKNFSSGRQRQGFQQALKALGREDASHAQTGVESFFEQVQALDSGQATLVTIKIGAGVGQRSPEFFEAGILLTLYNADRHLKRTILFA
ncbi:MAG: hypothetical protein ABSG60_12900, partial [Terracidiphilus sp.]